MFLLSYCQIKRKGEECADVKDWVNFNKTKKEDFTYCKILLKLKFCDSCRIQTCNLLIRSQMLYSVELRSRFLNCECKGMDYFFNYQIFWWYFNIYLQFSVDK